MSAYGVPESAEGMLPWSWAEERLVPAHNYWVVTAGPVTAGLWQVSDGRLLLYLRGHKEPLTSASFSPDGQRILTSSRDGTVRTYTCDLCGGIDGLLALANARLAGMARPLTPAQRERYLPGETAAARVGP